MKECVIGVFPGEGVGPEVTRSALRVLDALESSSPQERRFLIREGGAIGHQAISDCGSPLSAIAIGFVNEIFAQGGAILAGPGGDRFVYECRRQFNLFYKLNPLLPSPIPLGARRLRPQCLDGVDILVVRENLGGIYQGEWHAAEAAHGARLAEQRFSYTDRQILQVAEVACAHARRRRGQLTLVTKPNGIPAISDLWLDCTRAVAERAGIELVELEVDYAAFALIQHPQNFDVVLTSNLFGDILADIGGILLGSRGLCHGASFSASGAAIYQTNHGAALDIAGRDLANPVGHLQALAMLLEHSFDLTQDAQRLMRAIGQVWQQGWRTADLAEPGCRTIGTDEMGRRIAAAIGAEATIGCPSVDPARPVLRRNPVVHRGADVR